MRAAQEPLSGIGVISELGEFEERTSGQGLFSAGGWSCAGIHESVFPYLARATSRGAGVLVKS